MLLVMEEELRWVDGCRAGTRSEPFDRGSPRTRAGESRRPGRQIASTSLLRLRFGETVAHLTRIRARRSSGSTRGRWAGRYRRRVGAIPAGACPRRHPARSTEAESLAAHPRGPGPRRPTTTRPSMGPFSGTSASSGVPEGLGEAEIRTARETRRATRTRGGAAARRSALDGCASPGRRGCRSGPVRSGSCQHSSRIDERHRHRRPRSCARRRRGCPSATGTFDDRVLRVRRTAVHRGRRLGDAGASPGS